MAHPLLARRHKPVVPDSLKRMEVHIDNPANGNTLSFTMQRVEGGAFMMGATADQADADVYTDKPAHLVFLSPYYIATTEVTSALWHAVMPERDTIGPKGYPTNPINYVSWNDCLEFVRRMDSITGLPFRLPTEAEWEYAARGGDNSRHFRFAGGNEADSVGWTYSSSGNWTHPVARKHPNELGLYDMTGNVSEWCQDRFGAYQLSTTPDPCGPDTGIFRIVRGGSYDECKANSHLSVRRWYKPETSAGYIGFRLAMTLPDNPALQPQPVEMPLTRSVRIKGRKLRFIYVPAEQPYYISEEVECSLWRKMMQAEPPDRLKNIAVGMSRAERIRFAEYCSRAANEALFVASDAQTLAAEQHGLIEPFTPDAKPSSANSKSTRSDSKSTRSDSKSTYKKKTVRQIQHQRRIADKLSSLTELVGFRLPKPDDPVLLQFKQDADDSRPLRLVIPLR
ncbi:MAG: SUMF1/EgtB/PvdO family nonheme iron enzyme [Paludibacteraceae bacterium]|nr:SUMF1/EgtB/PvdO family nonheme iron enzyme [Paludibacteraceae bacterium]